MTIVPPDYWFRVIVDLERVGYSLRALAKHCGASKSAVERYKAGRCEPRYSEGMRMIALHRLKTSQVRDGSGSNMTV